MKYTHLFFDLDGTLVDSGEGILKALRFALNKFGIEENSDDILNTFIGPPLLDSFNRVYGFDEDKAMLGVQYYREYYNEIGIKEAYVYEGMEEALISLKENGYVLAVATSKPEFLAVRVLEHFGLAKYFDTISGASPDEKKLSHKDAILNMALNKYGVDRSKCLMIGDRKFDVLGAKTNGIDCMGVLFGYGDKEELQSAGAKYVVNTPFDVATTIKET